MKKTILTIALCVAATLGAAAATKPGVEVLRDNDFKQLAGKRVGLITNPTGVDNNLKSTVDILHEAKGVELVALFGPEHGVRGNVHAGDEFGNTTDPATGVKVFSIYGKTKKPTKEMLSGIDALVYDIQDIGCRSFTFVSTLGLALDACAENDIEFVVLDRPNPLGGNRVEGCLVEDGFYSFVSQFKIPYLYGMTPGEMARYLNGERVARGEKAAKLTVVPLKGWKRSMHSTRQECHGCCLHRIFHSQPRRSIIQPPVFSASFTTFRSALATPCRSSLSAPTGLTPTSLQRA